MTKRWRNVNGRIATCRWRGRTCRAQRVPDQRTVLRAAGASTVSDALDALGLPGAVLGIASFGHPQAIAGRVVTTQLGREERPKAAHLGSRAIDAAAAGDVAVMS